MVESQEAVLPPGAWPNYVLGNHDEIRIATRYGNRRARMATLMLLTLRGTPTLYYGDELGMVQADIPPEEQQDPWGRRQPGLGRDGCRTPMQWNAQASAGFTTGQPWLATVDPDGATNVEAQLDDPDSMINFTRRLLAVRKGSPALRVGSYEAIEGPPETIFAYRRLTDGETVCVYLNFGDEPVPVPAEGEVLVATSRNVTGPVNGELTLGRLDGAMLRS